MTQAYNLSQLANNLTSAGKLDATDGLVNAVPLANGGTAATTAAAARTNLGVAAAIYAVPAGGIILWSGSVASVPSGWFLCNGANGTPNLLDRFVVCAGSGYAVGQTGGAADAVVVGHTHVAQSADISHSHSLTATTSGSDSPQGTLNYPVYNGSAGEGGGTGTPLSPTIGGMSANATHTHTINTAGVTGINANLPPFYALAYIMKS